MVQPQLQGLHNIYPDQACYGRNSAGVEYYEFSCVYPAVESMYMRYVGHYDVGGKWLLESTFTAV